jgi:hypothetical protein
MNRIYIKFATWEDEVKAIYPLLKFTVVSLPTDVFGLPEEALKVLQDEQIKFEKASREEVDDAYRILQDFQEGKVDTRNLRKSILEKETKLG